MNGSSISEDQPTRWQALLFAAKAWAFRSRRAWQNATGVRPRCLEQRALVADASILAESRSPLYASTLAAEFALQAGKVQNLRVTARALNGRVLRVGELFSFWAHVPRPTRGRNFAPGRELREGCIIPSIGGGLCQLTNVLYDAALTAGFEIAERHGHSRKLPGSMAESGRDATIFWNYVDLRFRAPVDCQLEVTLTRAELVVRFRQLAPVAGRTSLAPAWCHSFTPGSGAPVPDAMVEEHPAESCETCGMSSCFRNPAATTLPRNATTAWLVDAWWPEHDAYLARQRQTGDWLFTPLDSRRFGLGPYRWDTRGFVHVKQAPWFVLKRSLLSRRLAAQGAARQRALLRMDAELAKNFARRIPYTALHLVVSQNLLPFLWQEGVLAGRTFDVLMTRLPLAELQTFLDRAAAKWPAARTLTDFRADAALVTAETEALAEARQWITPHSEIARLAGRRAVKLDWHLPKTKPRHPGRRFVFPASPLARKGLHELHRVARERLLPVTLAGPMTESDDFWHGCNVVCAGDDWLADAAAVVLPAWVENQPRRLLSAVAAGIPVIASDACGLEDVPGVTTVESGDCHALASAIDAIASRSDETMVEAPALVS